MGVQRCWGTLLWQPILGIRLLLTGFVWTIATRQLVMEGVRVVGRQNADIANTLHLRDVAMATTFDIWWAITSVVWWLATRCLILGVGFRGQAIRWRHSRFPVSKGRCHRNHFWLTIYGVHIGAIWRIRVNRPCAATMRPYVKLLWPLVNCGTSVYNLELQDDNRTVMFYKTAELYKLQLTLIATRSEWSQQQKSHNDDVTPHCWRCGL